MSRRMRKLLALLFALSIFTAACGDDDDTGDDTSTETDDGADDATGDDDAGADDDADSGDDMGDMDDMEAAFSSSNCLSTMMEFTGAFGAAFSGISPSDAGEIDYDEFAAIMQTWAETAPAEIRDDFELMAEQLGAFYVALGELFGSGEPPTEEDYAAMTELIEDLDQDALSEASDNIDAWFDANCDV